MEKQEIITRIKKVLGEEQFMSVHNCLDSINEDTSFIEDLAFDSIQILELIVALEQEFNFSCEPYELSIDIFTRFEDLITFIEKKGKDTI